jgi:hypothetical protein
MRKRILFFLAVSSLVCLVYTVSVAQTYTYRNDEFKFAMEIPLGYILKGTGITGANVNSSEVVFSNNATQEKIIVALNRNTDEQMKKMYWDMFNNPRSSTIILMKKEREGRVLSKRKIDKPAFEGFATVSENMTHQTFLLQEVKLFPKSGMGSAIVSFLYRAQDHPKILKIIDEIEYKR